MIFIMNVFWSARKGSIPITIEFVMIVLCHVNSAVANMNAQNAYQTQHFIRELVNAMKVLLKMKSGAQVVNLVVKYVNKLHAINV